MKVLDIGAGNTSFWRQLKWLNPQIKTVICGDIQFQKREYDLDEGILTNIGVFLSKFSKILTKEELEQVIEKTKKWVFKVFADYRDIPLDDESMDMVTLNSPHPLMYPGKAGFEEMKRVLKKWWVFYFWHSKDITVSFDENEMRLVWEWLYRYREKNMWKINNLNFPVSPIIRRNLLAHFLLSKWEEIGNGSWYIYGKGPTKIPLNPNWKAWEKV